jgi:hypothetical protein
MELNADEAETARLTLPQIAAGSHDLEVDTLFNNVNARVTNDENARRV